MLLYNVAYFKSTLNPLFLKGYSLHNKCAWDAPKILKEKSEEAWCIKSIQLFHIYNPTNVQTLQSPCAAVTRTLPDGGWPKECSICKSEMPSWTREGHFCRRVKASTLVPWHLWLKTSSCVANLCSVTLKIPTYFALIEWILYGIHAWSVRTGSNLNQKIKLLHHCSCKLTLFFSCDCYRRLQYISLHLLKLKLLWN